MEIIKLYSNKKCSEEITEGFQFEPVEAGKLNIKPIFIKNLTKFNLDFALKISGDLKKENQNINSCFNN